MFQDLTTLVLDIGTHSARVGYGGDEAPKLDCPSKVAYSATMHDSQKTILAGTKNLSLDKTDLQIQSIFRNLNQAFPAIRKDHYCQLVESLLSSELRVNLSDYSLLFSEDLGKSPAEILAQRTMISEFAFERLGVANIYFLKTPVLSCFATGRSTAVVVDSGHTSTRVSAVHDGFILGKSVKTVPIAGRALNQEFERVVLNKINGRLKSRYELGDNHYNQSFLDHHRECIIEDIKESFSQGSLEEGGESAERINYELPDRQVIQLEKSEFPDMFVYPEEEWAKEYEGVEYKGISNLIADAINSSDIDVKKEFYSNILISGGNMLLGGGSGLANNVISKLSGLAPPNARVKSVGVCAHSERKYLSWIGGSIVTSLSAFQSYWIGKEEYKSVGAAILQKKCN